MFLMQDLGASSVSIQPVIGCSRESEQESDWVEGGWVGGGVGGRSLVGLINQEKMVCPSAAEPTSMLTQREVGRGWHLDY